MAEPNQNQVRKSLGNTTFRPDTPRPTKVNERKFSFDVNDEELVFHIKEPAMPVKQRAKLDDEVEVVEIPEPEKVFFEWFDSKGRKFYDEYEKKRTAIPSNEVEEPKSRPPLVRVEATQIRSPSPVKHVTAIDSLLHIIKDVRVPIEAKIGVVITISSLASEVRSMMNQDFCEPFHEICSEILKRQDYAEISAALSLLELMIKTDAKFMITFRDFLEPLANENDVVNRATYLLRYMNNE